jgi:hypothetical protein
MAIITISNTGGNFNATGTWVGGVVPVAGDSVVATATSGQLTVNVASGGVGLLSFNMTNYTNVLTMNSTLTIAGALTLVAGMGTIAGTGAIICNTTATLTSGGKVIPALTLSGTSQTYTLADQLSATTLRLSGVTAQTFAGAFNIIAGTVSNTTAGCTYNFKDGQTLTVNTALNMNTGTSASHNVFSSSHPTNTTALILTQGATQDNSFLDGTRVNSSGGKTIASYKGVLTTTTNWGLLPINLQPRSSIA